MPAEAKDKSKDKDKEPKKDKAHAAAKPAKPDKTEKAAKPEKTKAKDQEAAAAEKPKKVEPARPPADPRMKVYKKLSGRYLPKGALRDRWSALEARWKSGDDHGGVSVDELRSLLTDWRAAREKPARKTTA